MAAFDLALARVQQDRAELFSRRVDALARALDHTFRQTTLTPGNTLTLFVRQIAHGNVACTAMRHLAGEEFSDTAWCQARARLPLELITHVQRLLVEQARQELDLGDDVGDGVYRGRGHRVHVIDGSSDSMPDTPQGPTTGTESFLVKIEMRYADVTPKSGPVKRTASP